MTSLLILAAKFEEILEPKKLFEGLPAIPKGFPIRKTQADLFLETLSDQQKKELSALIFDKAGYAKTDAFRMLTRAIKRLALTPL